MTAPSYPVMPVASGQTPGYVGSPTTFELPDAGDSNIGAEVATAAVVSPLAGDLNANSHLITNVAGIAALTGVTFTINALAGSNHQIIVVQSDGTLAFGDILTVIKAIGLPTADPHSAGALWANAGVVTVSAG